MTTTTTNSPLTEELIRAMDQLAEQTVDLRLDARGVCALFAYAHLGARTIPAIFTWLHPDNPVRDELRQIGELLACDPLLRRFVDEFEQQTTELARLALSDAETLARRLQGKNARH